MKELEARILQLVGESDDDVPSFGNGDSDGGKDDSTVDGGDSGDVETGDGDLKGPENDSTDGNSQDGKDGDDSDSDDSDSKDDNDKEDKDGEDDEEEEDFNASSIDDFLKQTGTKVKITLVSTEPSSIFGSGDTKDHNKYRVTLTNEDGSVWFYFWDSIYNTENGNKPTVQDVVSCFGLDVGTVFDGMSVEEFKKQAGYDKVDDTTGQDAYNSCRKTLERAQKLFSDGQIQELLRLSSEL